MSEPETEYEKGDKSKRNKLFILNLDLYYNVVFINKIDKDY